MDANANGDGHHEQNAEFIRNIIEGIDPFASVQNTRIPQQAQSLSET
ncbi:22917_t:CDS:1, partial [Gigaspora margarita]